LARWSRSWWIREAGGSAGKVAGGGAACLVLGLLYPRRLQKTYHAAKFVVGALRGLDWTCLGAGGRLDRFHIRVHLWWVGFTVGPSVVGRDWSPVSSNKARGHCCRTPGDHRAPLQPRRTARWYLRIRGTSLASRLPGDRDRGRGRACAGAASASYASYVPLWFYIYVTVSAQLR
jgi:hypothetical protein